MGKTKKENQIKKYKKFLWPLNILLVLHTLNPTLVYAFQEHPAPEGLYVHEMAHIFLISCMIYFIIMIRKNGLILHLGWKCIQKSSILFLLWNIDTLLGHIAGTKVSADIFINHHSFWTGKLVDFSPWAIIYYLTKYDHILCVPALYYLFRGLSTFKNKTFFTHKHSSVYLPVFIFPMMMVDVIGASLMIVLSFCCLIYAITLVRNDKKNVIWRYLFLLSLSFSIFSISRSAGHILKFLFIYDGMEAFWYKIRPISGAINTLALAGIGSVTIFFQHAYEVYSRLLIKQQAISNLNVDLENKNKQLTLLNRISQILHKSLEPEDVFNNIIIEIKKLLSFKGWLGFLVDQDTNELIYFSNQGLPKKYEKEIKVLLEKGYIDTLIANHNRNTTKRTPSDILPEPFHQKGNLSILALFSEGQLYGAIYLYREGYDPLSDNELNLMRHIAYILSLGLKKITLYHKIKKAYEELKEAQNQLIQTAKLASLGRLSASIAHEINNPLASIVTYSSLILKILEDPEKLPKRVEELTQFVQILKGEAELASDVVKNLLLFARESEPRMEENDINEIVQKAVKLMSHDLKLEKIEMKLELDSNLPPVKCDFKQIQQVLLNIMVNSCDAMPEGGTISIKTRKLPDDEIQIQISDTGVGISKEHLARIFEPFFTTKSEMKGVGLGLAICYGIIEKHGGTIEVESTLGKGTTFFINLPCII